MFSQLQDFRNEAVINPWEQNENELIEGLRKARELLKRSHNVLIGDVWVEGKGGRFHTLNPNNTSEEFGPFFAVTSEQAKAAFHYAEKIQKEWGRRPSSDRVAAIRRVFEAFHREKWTLIGLLMIEIGKTALEAEAEWAEAVDFLDYYARSADLIHDRDFKSITLLPGFDTRLEAKALGVGLALTPFNFPCAIFSGMWAAPTVMGNVVIIKPSPRAVGVGTYCVELFHQCEVPVQLIVEDHDSYQIGADLVAHPDMAFITFTGSKRAGFDIVRRAADTSTKWIKRVVAEMGGCDFIAVHDVADWDNLISSVRASAIGYQGQKCSALSRLIVREELYDEVKKRLLENLSQVRLTPTEKKESLMGGVIDGRSQEMIVSQLAQLQSAGAKIILGGKTASDFPGYGVLPTVHEGLDPFQEEAGMEIFGPVFGLYKCRDWDELVTIANVTPYNLTGSVFLSDPTLINRITEFNPGNLYLNRKCTGAYVGSEPFGGWFASGTDDKAGHWSHLLRFIWWQTVSAKV